MRIFTHPLEAIREVERDLWEMGIDVTVQSMQNKAGDLDTKELQAYAFKIANWDWDIEPEHEVLQYLFKDYSEFEQVAAYINMEFGDRVGGQALNPGNSWKARPELWKQFMVGGKFHYTYSERMALQLQNAISELDCRPGTRQAIITIHSNIAAMPSHKTNVVMPTLDFSNMSGKGRIPCSMYYQLMQRNDSIDLVYTMRSCDFLTHFPVDLMLALRLQSYVAARLHKKIGVFTYFSGSLHAYKQDMAKRGIF